MCSNKTVRAPECVRNRFAKQALRGHLLRVRRPRCRTPRPPGRGAVRRPRALAPQPGEWVEWRGQHHIWDRTCHKTDRLQAAGFPVGTLNRLDICCCAVCQTVTSCRWTIDAHLPAANRQWQPTPCACSSAASSCLLLPPGPLPSGASHHLDTTRLLRTISPQRLRQSCLTVRQASGSRKPYLRAEGGLLPRRQRRLQLRRVRRPVARATSAARGRSAGSRSRHWDTMSPHGGRAVVRHTAVGRAERVAMVMSTPVKTTTVTTFMYSLCTTTLH